MAQLGESIALPCLGCVACCYGGAKIRPEFGDDQLDLQVRVDAAGNTLTAVDEDGLCVYAVPGVGCSLYDGQRPVDCPAFDCREARDDPQLREIAHPNILMAAELIDARLAYRE